MTNLYFFHLHACYSIFQNFFCAGIQFFVVLNSYTKRYKMSLLINEQPLFVIDFELLIFNISAPLREEKSV